jgi:putative hydrolase of the HAD superfamily
MTKLFVFDLGNVILPFANRQIAEKLQTRSTRDCTVDDIFCYLFDLHAGSVNAYEEGSCSSLEFFLDVKNRFGLETDFSEFRDIWNEIFSENKDVGDVISELKAKGFPLFLLSNTNELHFAYVMERYPIVRLMDEWILSFRVGAKKPKRRMYEAIFEKTDVRAEEVFYIDDVEEYVDTARAMGISGHVFRGPAELRDALRGLGVIG